MARRRDMYERMAQLREQGAQDLTLRRARNVLIVLRGLEEERDADGKTLGFVSRVEIALRVAGLREPVWVKQPVKAGPGWTLRSEILEALGPAIQRCFDELPEACEKAMAEQQQREEAGQRPLLRSQQIKREAEQNANETTEVKETTNVA